MAAFSFGESALLLSACLRLYFLKSGGLPVFATWFCAGAGLGPLVCGG
jgi:hypothetical protein